MLHWFMSRPLCQHGMSIAWGEGVFPGAIVTDAPVPDLKALFFT
jgi:hypothetical protein